MRKALAWISLICTGLALPSLSAPEAGDKTAKPPGFRADVKYFCDLIHTELRHQYLLGYVPSNGNFDGKWRKIKVRLEPPEGLPKLRIRAKEGYLAPRQ